MQDQITPDMIRRIREDQFYRAMGDGELVRAYIELRVSRRVEAAEGQPQQKLREQDPLVQISTELKMRGYPDSAVFEDSSTFPYKLQEELETRKSRKN